MGLTKISGGVIQSDNFSVGVITATSLQIGSATTIHTTGIDLGSGNITSHNINSTGIITARSGIHVTGNNSSQQILYGDGTTIGYFISKTDVNRGNAEEAIHIHDFRWNGTAVARIKGLTGDDTVNKDNGSLTFETSSGAGLGERMRIASNGNVGIGSDNPSEKLDVSGHLKIDNGPVLENHGTGDALRVTTPTGYCSIGANNSSYAHFYTDRDKFFFNKKLIVDQGIFSAYNEDLHLATNSSGSDIRLTILNSNGNIGIGTDNPQEKLHVLGTSDFVVDTDNSALRFGSYGEYDIALVTGRNTPSNSSRVYIENGNGEALRITSSGAVGINSTIPGSVVDIMGQTSEDAIVNIRSYDKDSAIKLWPSDDHDLDRWRMAFWENDADTLGNDYPDWMVDGYGRQWQKHDLHIGRQRSFADSPSSYYPYYGTTGPGVFIYNGVDGDTANHSAYLELRCYQTDTDDRNIIYYANAGTTTTLDYDAHQTFGVKASGRVQGLRTFFSGRVESDEGSPNSVYYSGRGGYYGYDTTSTAVAYLIAEAGGSSSTYFAFGRTSNDDVQWKHRTSDGRMYVDATGTTFNGADYAEYFEWSDGNTNNEDRAGYTVVLKNGNKIGIATAGDSPSSIIGVISGVPAIIGDGQDLSWQGKWLKDEFGREITTDVQYLVWNRGYEKDENGNKVPVAQPNPNDQMSMQGSDEQIEVGSKLDAAIAEGNVPQFAIDNNIIMTGQRRVKNPDYNPDAIYVSREFRPEWSPVGLVGKLIVRKGQVMGERWIKMKDINEQLEQWLVR